MSRRREDGRRFSRKDKGIAGVVLDAPDSLDALDETVRRQLGLRLDRTRADPEPNVTGPPEWRVFTPSLAHEFPVHRRACPPPP